MSARITEALLEDLRRRLPEGGTNAIHVSILAADMGVNENTLSALAEELIDRGELLGTTTTGEGFFLITSYTDLVEGTRYLRSRARSIVRRVSRLKKAAGERFGPESMNLFSLEDGESH